MRFSTSYSASSSSLVMSMAPRRTPLRARSPAQTARARGLAREAGSRATRPASPSPSGPTARALSMGSRIDWVGGRAAGEGAGGARRSSPPRALWPSRAAAAVPRFQPRAHPRIWIGHNSHSLAFQTRAYSPDRPRGCDPMLRPFRLRRSRNARANPDRPRPHPVLEAAVGCALPANPLAIRSPGARARAILNTTFIKMSIAPTGYLIYIKRHAAYGRAGRRIGSAARAIARSAPRAPKALGCGASAGAKRWDAWGEFAGKRVRPSAISQQSSAARARCGCVRAGGGTACKEGDPPPAPPRPPPTPTTAAAAAVAGHHVPPGSHQGRRGAARGALRACARAARGWAGRARAF